MTEASRISNVGNFDAVGRLSDYASYETSKPARVLVIDDDRSMQQVLGEYLEQHNMRAVPVVQRQDVARLFAAGEPSMVILESSLVRTTVFNCCARSGRVPTFPLSSPPVIATTR